MTGVIWSELGVKVEKSFPSVNVRVNCWEIRVFFSRLRRNAIFPLSEKNIAICPTWRMRLNSEGVRDQNIFGVQFEPSRNPFQPRKVKTDQDSLDK